MASARTLPNEPPARDLWPGILSTIAPEQSRVTVMRPRWRREFKIALPQLLAASVALMLLSGGAVWMMLQRSPAPSSTQQRRVDGVALVPQGTQSTPEGGATQSPGGEAPPLGRQAQPTTGAQFASSTSPRYDATIADLERVLSEGRGTLDSSTVRILEENLAIIDRAGEHAARATRTRRAATWPRIVPQP